MTIDPRTIAADIMCGNARSITPSEVWAHIGQAYDVAEIDATIADDVAELIAKTGIDLIWPDGMKDTELGAARVEIERRDAELAQARAKVDELTADVDRLRAVIEAAKVWRQWYGNPKPSYASACNDLAAAMDRLTDAGGA